MKKNVKHVVLHLYGVDDNRTVHFVTTRDDMSAVKEYRIMEGMSEVVVGMEEGNKHWKDLINNYQSHKAITIFDEEPDIQYTNDNGHFVITVDGNFYCTCDNMKEVREAIQGLKEKRDDRWQ